jgi:hypothetical protein
LAHSPGHVLRTGSRTGAAATRARAPATGRFYDQNCADCHDAHAVRLRALDPNMISRTSADAIYLPLKTGSMVVDAKRLSDAQKRQIAEFLSGNQSPGEPHRDISAMKNRCPAAPPGDPFQGHVEWLERRS